MIAASCGSKDADDEAKPADAVATTTSDAAAPALDAGVAAPLPPPTTRQEHAVFSLVDNRHAAHRYVDGEIVLDAADIGFTRYTRFGVPATQWHVGKTVAGVRATTVDRFAMLEVPLDGKMARAITRVVIRVHGKTKQQLALRINGRRPTDKAKTSRVELADGWQTVTLAVDRGRLGVGENQIGFETAGAKDKIAVEWIRFAGKDAGTDDPRASIAFDAKANTVAIARNATALWYVTVPEGAHFVGEVTAPCKVELQAIASDDSFAGGALAADTRRVDLTKMAGRVVGLLMTARECPIAKITAPEIRVQGPAPARRPAAEPPRYVILWVMDALRADKVATFTPGARAQTPNLDELAKSSAIFRQFYVQGNESQTSHSTMWTGLYPAVHNVRVAGAGGVMKLELRHDVLATKLGDAGMYAAAVTGNGFVTADNGYARGFKEYRSMMREKGAEYGVIYGDKILAAALGRLDANRDKPTYLVIGTIDTHAPWIARKPWIDTYSPGPYNGPFKDFGTAKDLGFKPGSMGCGIIPAPADIERLRAIYDSAVSYQDQLVGTLVAQLKSWGIWEQTMLIITADHGEELFEDRRCGHGGSLRESLVRVPLLVRDPARFPGGTIVDEGAEAVDLMPTILDALGAPAGPAVQGESLAARAQGVGRSWARPSYASMHEYAHAMRIGRWKIRVGPPGVPMVVDLVADPSEAVDLAGQRPVERRMLTDNLGLFLALRAQWKKSAWGVTTNITKQGAAALDEARIP